ncbi:MAG: preprotein translocase subunit SecG [Chloroflexi bacterium]|nr:preprotein translocase subunit SecG [Chloroflexota bacterium]
MVNYLRIAQMIVSAALIVAVLLQTKGTGLGGIFGGEAGIYKSRRGVEKTLFQITILLAVVFFAISLAAVALPPEA